MTCTHVFVAYYILTRSLVRNSDSASACQPGLHFECGIHLLIAFMLMNCYGVMLHSRISI